MKLKQYSHIINYHGTDCSYGSLGGGMFFLDGINENLRHVRALAKAMKSRFLLARLAYIYPLSRSKTSPNLVRITPPKQLDGLS